MAGKSGLNESRRTFVRLLGQGSVLIPILGLEACGKPQTTASAASAPAPASAPERPQGTAMDAEAGQTASSTQAASGSDLPHISTDDPAARAVGFSLDASKVDRARYPEHLKGQVCRKCVQFKGGPTDPWGPCMVFAGKQVPAGGWCTSFAARV
jgi:hypothetical protein